MSKTLIPEDLRGKELFKFLVENKSRLIATKKAAIKWSDSVTYQPDIIVPAKRATVKSAAKDGADEEIPLTGVLKVKVACNSAWFCDSQMDVLTDTCYDKTIKEKGILIPFIADHIQLSTGHIADVTAVYTEKINLRDLGLDQKGTTTVAVMEGNVREDFNEDTYKFYKNGKINQHSIGLIYVSIGMCINDKEYLPEYEMWQKYYDKVINKDVIDERGYFWVVPEIKWMENSCVLFGSNVLTPTLEVTDTAKSADIDVTEEQPSNTDKAKTMCPNCAVFFDTPDTASVNCPGCGQYVSASNNSAEMKSEEIIAMIQETNFFTN